jgi:hypothetical protein
MSPRGAQNQDRWTDGRTDGLNDRFKVTLTLTPQNTHHFLVSFHVIALTKLHKILSQFVSSQNVWVYGKENQRYLLLHSTIITKS